MTDCASHPDCEVTLYAEARTRFPGQVIAYGIDHRGPWARIGEVVVRAKPPTAALEAAIALAGAHP